MDFAGKVVLITGGSSGIGLAIAKEFAKRQARVYLAARHESELDRVVDSIESDQRGCAACIVCDVDDPEQVRHLVDQITREAGVPDILINSAGVVHPGYVQELELEKFSWMMKTNFFGTLHTVNAVLPGMLQRGSGIIVNIGSIAAYIGAIGYTAYSASKFAVRGYTEALRMELKPHGIQVSIVLPPDTDTPQLVYDNLHKPAELKYIFPVLGVTSPEKVARAVIRGIERKKYEIVPDFGSKVVITGSRFIGGFLFTIEDILLKLAQRRIRNENGKKAND